MKKVFFLFLLTLIFSFSVFADGDAIRVLHTKVIRVRQGENINIKANILNAHKVNYVILHYKNINDKSWSEKEMVPKDGFYAAEINPDEMGSVGVVYYIEVIDIESKTVDGFLSKENPQYVDIIESDNKNKLQVALSNEELKNEDEGMDDEFAVFLEDEIEEKVVTASKYAQSRSAAPANISVVTAKDIKEYGYHSLIEILRDQGFDVNDNGSWPDVGLRGINDRTTYGKYLLVFIDGHNMSFTQFYRNIISKGLISLEDIQKIEIQKGPGSSIWGANALLGVINIVTKKYNSKNEITVSGGTHNTFSSHARVVKEVNKNVSVFGSVMTYRDNTSSDMVIKEWSDVAKKDVTINGMTQDSYTFLGKVKLWDFNLTSYYNRYDPYAPITTFSVGGDDTRLVTNRFYNALNYDKELVKKKDLRFSLNVTLSHDRYAFADGAQYEKKPYDDRTDDCTNELVNKEDEDGNPISIKGQDGNPLVDENGNIVYEKEMKTECGGRYTRKMAALDNRYEGKIYTTLGYDFSESFGTTILAGFDYEHLETTRWYYPEVFEASNIDKPVFSQNNMGAFLQAEFNLLKMVSIVGGARYDKNSIYKAQLSPKASLVVTLGNFFFKGIWGQGFKAPSLHELYYFRKNAYYGNPSVEPETSNSIEAQIGYNKRGFLDIELTFFRTGIDNVISYSKKTDPDDFSDADKFPSSQLPDGSKDYNQQANKNEYRTTGGEVFIKYTPLKEFYISLRGGYNIAERRGSATKALRIDKDTFSDTEKEDPDKFYRLDYGQQYFMSFGLNYRLFKKYNFNLSGRYTSDKYVPKKNFKETGNPDNPTEDVTFSSDPYFVLNLNLFADDLFVKGLTVSLKVENLLNQRYYDAGREVLYPQTGMRVWGGLQYKF